MGPPILAQAGHFCHAPKLASRFKLRQMWALIIAVLSCEPRLGQDNVELREASVFQQIVLWSVAE